MRIQQVDNLEQTSNLHHQFNGRTSDFQSDSASSILAWCSIFARLAQVPHKHSVASSNLAPARDILNKPPRGVSWVMQIVKDYMEDWRNGRRARIRIQYHLAYGFKSHILHHMGYQSAMEAPRIVAPVPNGQLGSIPRQPTKYAPIN